MSLPSEMFAIEISQPGGPEVLRLCQRPVPEYADDEVLIRVVAAGVNRPDLMQRCGLYPPPPGASDIPGLEVAGEIVAVGARAAGWKIGDLVCALVTGGGYAEYCSATALLCLPIPTGLSLIQAAALPETFFTVWSNLFDQARLQSHESVLIHGGAGGIGVAAIQLAKIWGATVYTTAGSADKCRYCVALGADVAINYNSEDFVERIHTLTQGRGIDVILDCVGSDYLQRNLNCLAMDGRLLQIGVQQGPKTQINLLPLLLKRLSLSGSTLRPRSVRAKAVIADHLQTKVWPVLASGRIRPEVQKVFSLADAAAAHTHMDSAEHYGKIVLQVSD